MDHDYFAKPAESTPLRIIKQVSMTKHYDVRENKVIFVKRVCV